MKVRRLLIALVAGFALLVTACGDDSDTSSGAGASTTAAADFNDADVAFAQGMIPHHQQAVEMADMALENAESDEVKDLAERIKAAQDPEIETMTAWLEAWGEPLEDSGGHDMGGMGDDASMMSDEDMESLGGAQGAAFDEMFLTMMIEHHRGAIDMAETELADGAYEPAKQLARAIVDAQQAEIDEMTQLLSTAG